MNANAERERLAEARESGVPWRRWGPYLSERQWGTVREDYSVDGDAWSYFSHDQARSRAYRWGEDGLAGISDEGQDLCFAIALWNGHDPILKERLFGLTNREGNHGEDVKEYYFYLDATPTSSYLRYLYKYPQSAYPYDDLVATNRGRGRTEPEYELLDTGVFDDDRYFDVFVEYAKAAPDDIAIRITAWNRGPETATLHLLPTLWYPRLLVVGRRSTAAGARPSGIRAMAPPSPPPIPRTADACSCANRRPSFSSPRTRRTPNAWPAHATARRTSRMPSTPTSSTAAAKPSTPPQVGTKAAAHHDLTIEPGGSQVVRLRLAAPGRLGRRSTAGAGLAEVDAVIERRRIEADDFYASVIPASLDEDAARVMRQALAGMLWTKQTYRYDVNRWLGEHGVDPFVDSGRGGRNQHWQHMTTADVISMPDKWEYPWFAAWDLAFHVLALTLVDEDFAKGQLELMLRSVYLHPSGQLPAYEWNFEDVNPPVHAWATIFTYRLEQAARGQGDLDWLERVFHKLLLNFTWWVNRKDRDQQQPVRGRLPRPRQHRRLRPERPAADRRLPRAGRRDGVDGPVLPEHARDLGGARPPPAGLHRAGREVRRALPVDRHLDDACRGRHGDVG